MTILRILGAALLFFIIRQFLKLIANVGQKQMPNSQYDPRSNYSTKNSKNDNIIDATFTRKE